MPFFYSESVKKKFCLLAFSIATLLPPISHAKPQKNPLLCNQVVANDGVSIDVYKTQIASSPLTKRDVIYALPKGKPPEGGWPVVVFYQGSIFKSSFNWPKWAPFGGYYESETLKELVKAGFAVVVPRAALGAAWMTNSGIPYELSSDYFFLKNVMDAIKSGHFGKLNSKKKFAAGMSSGGYNTSRMAISFPGEFLGLAIHSASYATCLGGIRCKIPKKLPASHPPALIVHGGKDPIVPIDTAYDYAQIMRDNGLTVVLYVNESAGHEYFPETPEQIVEWFKSLL